MRVAFLKSPAMPLNCIVQAGKYQMFSKVRFCSLGKWYRIYKLKVLINPCKFKNNFYGLYFRLKVQQNNRSHLKDCLFSMSFNLRVWQTFKQCHAHFTWKKQNNICGGFQYFQNLKFKVKEEWLYIFYRDVLTITKTVSNGRS